MVSLPARVLAAALFLATASLTIASLALVDVIPAWGILFFYVVPTLFFGVWLLGAFAPPAWRRTVTPLRRAFRLSRLSPGRPVGELPPPPTRAPREPRPRPERIGSLTDVLALAAHAWLALMRALLELWRAPRMRRTLELVFAVAAIAIVVLGVRRFASIGWPFAHARPAGTATAAAFFLSTFALRAVAWQRLFRPYERPRSLTLVTSTGTAAVAALALPSRIDDAISIGVIRKLGMRAPSVGTLALSLFLLGLMDMAALTPFAIFAALAVRANYVVRVAMIGLAGVGVGAAILAAALPSVRGSERLMSYRLGHWLGRHAPSSPVDAAWSWLLTGLSWAARIAGLFVLLDALGMHTSYAVATAYVVAGAAAAALPVGPAGAATQAGVGAAVLAGAGFQTSDAVALAVSAQALTVGVGAALGLFGGAVHLGARRRSSP